MSIRQLVNQNYKNVIFNLKSNKIGIITPGYLSSNSKHVTDFCLPFFHSKIQLRHYSHSSQTPPSFSPHHQAISPLLPLSSRVLPTKTQKIPLGIQNIEEVLKNDYVYIDKTSFAKQLIESGKYYFIN